MGWNRKVPLPAFCLIWTCLPVLTCLPASDEVPRFTVQPSSAIQKRGGSVTLFCAVEPRNANLSWRLNRQELSGGQDLENLGIHIHDGSLVVTFLRNQTAGCYQCVARTTAGAIASVPSTVTLANLQDFALDDQHVVEVDEGNTAVIECHLPQSNPKAQVRYNVKQEWLETSKGNYLIMPSGNLQIINATQEDEGMYKCAAYNPVTQEVKTSAVSGRLRVRRSSPEAARIIYPPEAQTIIVTKGQSLILECVASGTPSPRVTWAKNGVGVQNATRFLLSNLLIDGTTEEDSGTYSCTADNGIGESGAAVIIYSVQVFEPPEVTVRLQQQVVPWGQSAKFTCDIRGNPPPSVLWLRNASPVPQGPRYRFSRKALRVSNVGPGDEGIYQCMAENEVGSAQAAVRLVTIPSETLSKSSKGAATEEAFPSTEASRSEAVGRVLKEKASLKPWPTVSTAPAQCTSKEGQVSPAEAPVILSSPRTVKSDSYELLWKPRHDGGAPVLNYIVKHRKQTADSSDDWQVSHIPGNQHRLMLTKLDPSSLYEVEMAAQNCAGEGQSAMMTFRTGKGRSPSQKSHLGNRGPQMFLMDDAAPEAPDRPTISMASETSVYVTWIPRGNGGFPIQSFQVECKRLKKGGDWLLVTTDIPPSRLSVEIAGLEKGTSYRFRVRAVNVLGESPPSTASKPYVVSGYRRVYERPVTGPYITFTEAVNETSIMMKWMYTPSSNNNTPIHGFYIYYRPTDSDNDSDYKKDIVEGDRFWHSITHLQPETSYDIKMRCFNEGGESEFSNVMICETKARRFPTLPVAVPVLPHITVPVGNGQGHGNSATMARSSDLPYLIVGGVLGSMALIIVAFIPFCLWRAWAKQKQTMDLGFPSAVLPPSSCQYTMVPLRGAPPLHANGHCYTSGVNIPPDGECPLSRHGCGETKCLEFCPDRGPQGEMECETLLQKSMMGNGTLGGHTCTNRLPTAPPVDDSFFCSLPDDSTCELLPPSCDRSYVQETASSLCHVTGSGTLGNQTGNREPNIKQNSSRCTELTPVEEVESADALRAVEQQAPSKQERDAPGEERASVLYADSLPGKVLENGTTRPVGQEE
ncbi:brother of CDO isoform X2 [Latimeria chalumnae]|uniref:brother of CDO isoform X2 n=1 Tax=Latimeria chalumnae TaxID=7897 RepID=UPI00313DB1DF